MMTSPRPAPTFQKDVLDGVDVVRCASKEGPEPIPNLSGLLELVDGILYSTLEDNEDVVVDVRVIAVLYRRIVAIQN